MATYHAVHDAAISKDLKALLAAQGFDAKQTDAIPGLEGIEVDFASYANRFVATNATPEFFAKPGTAYVRIEGDLAPCRGDHMVLVFIAENPQ